MNPFIFSLLLLLSSPDTGRYHWQVFKRPAGGYGYSVYDRRKMLIRQETIPGLPGNRGFANKEDAAKVAKLVTGKLENNVFPPSISASELERLHIR